MFLPTVYQILSDEASRTPDINKSAGSAALLLFSSYEGEIGKSLFVN
jgi:hypothetical protein